MSPARRARKCNRSTVPFRCRIPLSNVGPRGHLLENLVLEDLAKARAYEFAFIMQPLKLQGATGSTVAPTAIR